MVELTVPTNASLALQINSPAAVTVTGTDGVPVEEPVTARNSMDLHLPRAQSAFAFA